MNNWKRNRDIFESCYFYSSSKICNKKNIIIGCYYLECEHCKDYIDEVAAEYQGIKIENANL